MSPASSGTHFLLTEGGEDQDGHFHKFTRLNDSLIAKFFSREVFSMLLHEGLINLELVQKILRWLHTGFNVHSKVRAKTRKDAEKVGKYRIRPLLSLKRLAFDETEGKVSYQYGNLRAEEERMDYLEFIARIIRHLKLAFHAERPPPPHVVQQELLMAAEERGEYF
ncbi:MAG: transposase [Candidatus Aminicenantes bacterium]|nr:transposase [Candidatus Aminicenantes bacterium]